MPDLKKEYVAVPRKTVEQMEKLLSGLSELCPEEDIEDKRTLIALLAEARSESSELAKRTHCTQEGHVTINELETTGANHGTKHVCLRCGRFWHNEPTPPEWPDDAKGD